MHPKFLAAFEALKKPGLRLWSSCLRYQSVSWYSQGDDANSRGKRGEEWRGGRSRERREEKNGAARDKREEKNEVARKDRMEKRTPIQSACIASAPAEPWSCTPYIPAATPLSLSSLPFCGIQASSDRRILTACDRIGASLGRQQMPGR